MSLVTVSVATVSKKCPRSRTVLEELLIARLVGRAELDGGHVEDCGRLRAAHPRAEKGHGTERLNFEGAV